MTKVYSQQSVLTGRKRKMSVEMGHFAVVDPLHRWFLYTSNYGSCVQFTNSAF